MTARWPAFAPALDRAAHHAREWLMSLAERPVHPRAHPDALAAVLGGPLPDGPTAPETVVDELAAGIEPGLMGMPSGRFFGWVIGGTHPAALAADWLTSAWDQNPAMRHSTPGVVAVEDAAAAWALDLLSLPAGADVGFVTGATMANFTGLAAARQQVLADAGWDVARDEHPDARSAREPVATDVPARVRKHVLPGRREPGEVGHGGAGDEPDVSAGRETEQVERPRGRRVLHRHDARHRVAHRRVLVPCSRQPVRRERGRVRASDDPAEEPAGRHPHQPGLDPGGELVDDRLGRGRSVEERSAQDRRQLVGTGARMHRPLGQGHQPLARVVRRAVERRRERRPPCRHAAQPATEPSVVALVRMPGLSTDRGPRPSGSTPGARSA